METIPTYFNDQLHESYINPFAMQKYLQCNSLFYVNEYFTVIVEFNPVHYEASAMMALQDKLLCCCL